MLITILNSKTDINGNRYWAVELSHLGTIISVGSIGCDNINVNELWARGVEVCREEMPIREFNRLTKKYKYIGSQWEEIRDHLFLRKE